MQKNKLVLVTGGAGFIGSHVVDVLIENGYQVRILDNLAAPTHDGNLPAWVNKKAEFLKGDVRIKSDWKKALEGADAVMHLAAYMDYHLDFSNYVRSNIESLALLYELILEKQLPIQKVIFASSQSVYGDGGYECGQHGLMHPLPRSEKQLAEKKWEVICAQCGQQLKPLLQKENDFLQPQTPYGISKLAGESLIFNLGRRYNVPSAALRYSIVLGPRQSFRHFYSGALRAFAADVLKNRPIQMNEDGLQTRDFVSVQDAARAHLVALENSDADWQAINIGSGQATKIIDLARIVAEESGVAFQPLLNGVYRVGDARHSVMNIEKMRSLGWDLKVSLKEAVRDYLVWVKQFGDFSDVLDKNYEQLNKQGILKNWSSRN